jgi:RimJ/RimL family protein N-acetyltransferase
MFFGKLVKLRALEMSDLDSIMEHWNTFEMRRFLYNAIPMSRVTEQEWLEHATKADPWREGYIVFAVEDKKTGTFLGSTGLDRISSKDRRAEFGIAIHNPSNHGKGYGTDATLVTLWIAFNVLGLNSVYLPTLSFNERAINAYEKAGFKQGGVLRQALFTQGNLHDLIYMDILAEEFFKEHPPGVQISTP